MNDLIDKTTNEVFKPSDYVPPDDDSDSYVQEYPDHFIFTNKKTGKETKVDK